MIECFLFIMEHHKTSHDEMFRMRQFWRTKIETIRNSSNTLMEDCGMFPHKCFTHREIGMQFATNQFIKHLLCFITTNDFSLEPLQSLFSPDRPKLQYEMLMMLEKLALTDPPKLIPFIQSKKNYINEEQRICLLPLEKPRRTLVIGFEYVLAYMGAENLTNPDRRGIYRNSDIIHYPPEFKNSRQINEPQKPQIPFTRQQLA